MLKIRRKWFVLVFIAMLLIAGCASPPPVQKPAQEIDPLLEEILSKADGIQDIPHLKTVLDASCSPEQK